MVISKRSNHLIADVCKSLEQLIKLIIIMGLSDAPEHLSHNGFILQAAIVWIQEKLSLLAW